MNGSTSLRALLDEVPFFERLSASERDRLSELLVLRSLADGETLFAQDAAGESMVLVLRGSLAVRVQPAEGGGVDVCRVGPGDVVGEMACLCPAPRSATVSALGAVDLCELDREGLATLERRAPTIAMVFIEHVVDQLVVRLRQTSHRLHMEAARAGSTMPQMAAAAGPADIGEPTTLEAHGIDLSTISPLDDLSDWDRGQLAHVGRVFHYANRTWICREGAEATSCYVLASGELDLFKSLVGEERFLTTLKPGSFAGQLALVDHDARPCSMRAKGDAVVIELDRRTFHGLVGVGSPLAMRLNKRIAEAGIRRLRTATKRLARVLGPLQHEVLSGLVIGRDSAFTIEDLTSGRPSAVTPAVISTMPERPLFDDGPQRRVRTTSQEMPAMRVVDGDADLRVVPEAPPRTNDVNDAAMVFLETALKEWNVTMSEVDSAAAATGA